MRKKNFGSQRAAKLSLPSDLIAAAFSKIRTRDLLIKLEQPPIS